MKTKIFDGCGFAEQKEKLLKTKFERLAKKGVVPSVIFVFVGKNQETRRYVSLKEKLAKKLGVAFTLKEYPGKTPPGRISQYIKKVNKNKKIAGIVLEYPLPVKLQKVLPPLISPQKDIDCLTPQNLGRLLLDDCFLFPSSTRAILEVLNLALREKNPKRLLPTKHYLLTLKKCLKGKPIAIVGFGNLVGRPLSMVLKNLKATVTVCDEFTPKLSRFTKEAEILISATGQAGLIKKTMIKKGAVVIDVGYPKGDCQSPVSQIASFFTPVPGGIGPVSLTCLFENLLELVQKNHD